jgi:hypothetical protein
VQAVHNVFIFELDEHLIPPCGSLAVGNGVAQHLYCKLYPECMGSEEHKRLIYLGIRALWVLIQRTSLPLKGKPPP